MKLDKDIIVRQRFWILLALVVPLVVVSVFILWLSVAGAVSEQEEKIKTSENALKSLPNPPKNKTWLEKLKDRNKLAEDKKKEIWKTAWESQESFMTWPKGMPEDLNGKPFGTPINESLSTGYTYANEFYMPEIEGIVKLVHPVNTKAEGILQFKDGWESVLHYVRKKPWEVLPPTSEEVWLAQEDLWIQKGLLLTIQDANNSIAQMQRLTAEPSAPKNGGSFTNSNWRLDLAVAQEEGNSILRPRITNIGARRQSLLGVRFRVVLGEEPTLVEAQGEPVSPNEARDLKPVRLERGSGAIKSVEQTFDWRTAPVKRIDKIELGTLLAQSHRTFLRPLIKNPVFDKGKEQAPPTTPATGTTSMPTPMMSIVSGTSGVTGTAGSEDVTPNGLNRKRYVEVTQAVRRMPVAMLVIVEESHIQDMLTAIANSKLRIQTTQVSWQHFRGNIKPTKEKDEDSETTGTERKKPSRASSGGLISMTGMGMTTRPGTGNTRPSAADEQSSDLVELSIYGLATLYENYEAPAPAK